MSSLFLISRYALLACPGGMLSGTNDAFSLGRNGCTGPVLCLVFDLSGFDILPSARMQEEVVQIARHARLLI